MKKLNISREAKIEMIKRLIQKDEALCARLCCQSWQIGENVFLKLLKEYGSEEQKRLIL